MANFKPLKNYILFCIDHLIDNYNLEGPFIDIGCGTGDVSAHFGNKGWSGKAIDLSTPAIAEASYNLRNYKNIKVEQSDVNKIQDKYKTLLLLDILEHTEDDLDLLSKSLDCMADDGSLIITVPSNMREWRWDDEYYGHLRRYSKGEIVKKLELSGLETIVIWDFTFPLFWIMRRAYVLLLSPKNYDSQETKFQKTLLSSKRNAWEIPFISTFLSKGKIIWSYIYRYQFHYFKKYIDQGHEVIILAKKIRK